MTVTSTTCPRCGESLLTALHVVDGCALGPVVEQAVGVIGDVSGLTPEECDEIARALDQAGLLAPAMREEWGEGPLENGEPSHWPVPLDGYVACDSAHPTYRRYVTEWEEA